MHDSALQGPTTIMKLRGLPFAATQQDVVRWFNQSDLQITPLNLDW